MRDLRHLGKSTPRPDAPDKATGKALYVQDLSVPGMLFGRIKFSEHAHARILHVDTSRAALVRGVRAVVTAYDTPEIRYGFLRDNTALKRGKVRQLRDEVAAVAAIDPDAAAEAVDLVRVEYEPLPAVFSLEEAMRAGAPLVHEVDAKGSAVTSNVLPLRYHHASGDLDAARRAARFVAEGTYTTPRIQQSCMGTAGCIASFDANRDLTIVAKTQIPFLAQRDFVRALDEMGLHGRNARVVVPTLGGAFGTGLDTHAYEYIAILLAHVSGRPVKIVYSREEEFAYLSPRQGATVRVREGCDERGRIAFREVDVLQDNGAYASWGATYPSVMMLPATSLYRVPAVRFDATVVYTNNTYCQAMRGYGNPEVTWAVESNLDDLAREAGIDPLELRRINCNRPGEVTPMGCRVTTCGLEACIESAARRIGWTEKRGKEKKRRRGVGIASLVHVGGSGRIYRSDGSSLILKIDDFGNVDAHYGGVEMGQGLHSALALMVAEALGILPERVRAHAVDTASSPWDVGTHASRGAFMAGKCVELAAKELRDRIFALAAQLHPAQGERRFDLRDGVVTITGTPADPPLSIDLGRLLRAAHFREKGADMLAAHVFYEPPTELPDWGVGKGDLSVTYAYGAQAVEVEVDEDTGDVRVLRVAAAHDVGRVLNRQTIEGQTYGALVQGLGYALVEEVKSDRGRILNPSFRDYKIPTIGEVSFPIEIEFVETDDARGPFGAKGVGEPGLVPTAPAIANAVWDAVGVRIHDLPITPEKVLAAIEAKKRSARER